MLILKNVVGLKKQWIKDEIKISVEAYIDDISYIVHDHYNGLTKGADYWYTDGYNVSKNRGNEEGLKQCPSEGL